MSSPGDGRNVDPSLGVLEGEGAEQETNSDRVVTEGGPPLEVWDRIPSSDAEGRDDPTYFDRPALKRPVWKWYVPAYFAVGGAAGAAAALGAAAQLADRRGLDGLIRRCRWVAATGGAVGTVLLIVDLGKPGRFLNMLRVFRPSSPMNIGSWVLATVAPAAAGSAVLSRPGGITGLAGDLSGLVSGTAGLPLAGYTAVLVANTAVPVWQGARRTGPPLFVSSGMSAAASLLQLMKLTDQEERIVRRFAVMGAAADLVSEIALEREAGRVDQVAKPLHEGRSGALLGASKALTAASLVLNLAPERWRWKRVLAGILGALGAVAVKFGIMEAGAASAADPRATFHQQRAGLGGAEATGRPAVASART